MDNSKQKASSSSSSIALELFGPKETPQSVASSSSSLASSTSIFGSIFGPPSTGMGGTGNKAWNVENGGPSYNNGKGSQQESIQPWHYSSSIYYGGQEVYSTSSVDTKSQYKKDGLDDEHGSHLQGAASRGDWWQGSLYY